MITQQQADDAIARAKIAKHFEGPVKPDDVMKVARDALTIAGVPWQQMEVQSCNCNGVPDIQYDGWGNSRIYAGPRYHTLIVEWIERCR
jgi:hypothetical protein